MFRYLVLFSFLVVSLFALDNAKILKRANTYMSTKSQSDCFRAYNDYKSLYLRAIVEDNNKLKRDSLNGIVKSEIGRAHV